MNPEVTSPTPMKDPMGMDYVPVYEDEGKPQGERKVLFYRNPMNPEVTSPVPMKDSMGMDYIPVYEDEAEQVPGTVRISPEKIQMIGVKSEEVVLRRLDRVIRTVGRVDPVENKVFVITTKVPGWIEKLHVGRTDQMVSRGDKLVELYSPDLITAQEEYLLALKGLNDVKASPYPEVKKGAEALLEAARQRLRYWDISEDQIDLLRNTGKVRRTMTIAAPATGSVTEKMVVEGQKIEPGEPLFKIIDHSMVWVYGEVYEYEMPYIKVGQTAKLSPAYSPGEVYTGKIEHIYSHLGSIRYVPEAGTEVRTAKVRVALPNRGHKLKPGMYLNVELAVNLAKSAVAVPDSAVLDSGLKQLVIVDRRDGTFEPREVVLGGKADGYYQITKGIKKGEWVVTSANFLLDSESNLKAAVGTMAGHQHGGAAKQDSAPSEKPVDHSGHSSGGASAPATDLSGTHSGHAPDDSGSHGNHLPVIDGHKGH
ncbi:MAG: efflux RND transporter periplasmic adaptor subunit [Deltaproteobacteria bacterium]|nr:efflux RND transporter periplasmic adaptor subunit [Deltaproteobacteria bacterium]